MTANPQAQAIEIRVDGAAQLFNTLDPFPFAERDLDSDAEEYIVGWARELARRGPFTIIVHLPAREADGEAARDLPHALGRFFEYRADVLGRELNELFRIGRIALMVGLAVFGLCLAASQAIDAIAGQTYLGRFLGDGLVIVGWVANWRPLEIFLYDWWPLHRRRNLYRRLAVANVIIKPEGTKP
jgi:hypothetical protein